MGICDRLHSWIQSFLTKRTLRIKSGEEYSKCIDVTSRVPQVAELGPVLLNYVQYKVNVEHLRSESHQRDLVVIVDETLKPHRQCAKAAKSVNSIMRAIKASFMNITPTLLNGLTWNTHSKPGLMLNVLMLKPLTVNSNNARSTSGCSEETMPQKTNKTFSAN